MKSLIKYPVILNTKYSLALRMLCIDLLDPLGLKSTPLVILRLNVIINSALKSTKATLHSHHSAIYSSLHGHEYLLSILSVLFLGSHLYNHDTLTSFSVYLCPNNNESLMEAQMIF